MMFALIPEMNRAMMVRPTGVQSANASQNDGSVPQGQNTTPAASLKPGDRNERGQEMVMMPSGHGSGCGHCTAMISGLVPRETLESIKQARYNEIMTHEMAHASAAGELGGPIQINFSNGIAVSGSVPVQIPAVNQERPEETMTKARKVYNAALAPKDPSTQDRSVAQQAQSLMFTARGVQSQNQARMALGNAGNPFQPTGSTPAQSGNPGGIRNAQPMQPGGTRGTAPTAAV